MNHSAISRRSFIKGTLALGCVAGLGIAAHGRELDPQELSVERRNIFLSRLPSEFDGFTIALLCDFHYGAYVDRVLKSAVQVANRANPDIVLLGGDFVTWHRDNADHSFATRALARRFCRSYERPTESLRFWATTTIPFTRKL